MSAALFLVSIGPGDPGHITPAAQEALRRAEVIIGYKLYVEFIQPLLNDLPPADRPQILPSPIGDEIGRAQQAIELARQGRRVALISSGDVGIYAMAAPVFELLHNQGWQGDDPAVTVVPGISAFQAVAARVGAAIGHDFCAISLSDLLTPWPIIERRIVAAAWADFVIALYNPRSKERTWQLPRAVELLRRFRLPTTPVVIARNITRKDESIHVTTLAELDVTAVDMFSLVLVGNSQSFILAHSMVTPRGYADAGKAGLSEHAQAPKRPASRASGESGARFAYPITLTGLADAAVVVCGGGAVGERKIRGLLDAAAGGKVGLRVRLISPTATPTCSVGQQKGALSGSRDLIFRVT